MSSDNLATLAYLALLLVALGAWFIAQARRSPGKTAQHAAIWGLIFIGVIAAIGLWGDVRQTVLPAATTVSEGGAIIVPRGQDGHYHVMAEVNGIRIAFVVDTGATDVVLTEKDAARAGIDLAALAYTGRARTANGEVRTAPIRIDISLGGMEASRLRASVNEGEMSQSLMGMSFLSRFSRVEIARGELVLTP
jgi:aspartyl protease family protein